MAWEPDLEACVGNFTRHLSLLQHFPFPKHIGSILDNRRTGLKFCLFFMNKLLFGNIHVL
jgi:hypothetical protein